jgi:hypothetical protein
MGGEYALRGHFDRGMAELARGLEIARRLGHDQWVLGTLAIRAQAYLAWCLHAAALADLAEAAPLAERVGSKWWSAFVNCTLVICRCHVGDLESAAGTLDGMAGPDAVPDTDWRRLELWARAEYEVARGNPAAALELTTRLVRHASRGGGEVIPLLEHLRARALDALDDSAAETAYRAALAGATQAAMLPLVWQIHAGLARLLRRQGRGAEAAVEVAAATRVIGDLTASISDPELRGTFVAAALSRIA